MGGERMRTAGYYLKIYGMLAGQYLKERMQFRVDFFCEIVGMIVVNIFEFLTYWVIFHSITAIGEWNFNEILLLYGFSLIAMSPQQLLLDNSWSLFHKVVSGEFLKYCFRPVNILFYYMSETVDVKGFSQAVLGIVFLAYGWKQQMLPVTVKSICLLLFFLFGAVLICMGLIILSSACGFLGGGTNAAMFLASQLKGYSRYPLSIFGKGIRFLFTTVIPVGFVAYYPVSYFLPDKGTNPLLAGISPVVGIIFFLFSCKVWTLCGERYAGTGS